MEAVSKVCDKVSLSCLKDNILVILVTKQVLALRRLLCCLVRLSLFAGCGCSLLLLSYSLFSSSISLLLCRHLLQAEEFLSVEFVELGVDVFDRVLRSGDNDVLTGACQSWRSQTLAVTYMALTRRFTTLMTSSRITKAVCRLASSTSVSTARAYVSLHLWIC